jgi:SAM-dependent methyltransferase
MPGERCPVISIERAVARLSKDQLKQEWNRLSGPWIEEMRSGLNSVRKGLLDEPMLEACGDVSGLHILDSGCGEGRFCRLLVARDAEKVLGVDLCEPMILAARELQGESDSYEVADVQRLDHLKNGTFDLAVSYLNQCDLPDFSANTREVFRTLKHGGRFIVANLHPMRSADGRWQRNAKGEKEHVIVDEYFNETERHWKMMDVEFTNFHRSLATYTNGFISAGFRITAIREPTVTEDQLSNYADLEDELRVPNFIIFELMKPTV